MTPNTLDILLNLLLIAGGVMTLYSAYFVILALFGFKKQKEIPASAPKTRFAVVVAARNEEAVIGNLIDSLAAQNYPKELYDVIVAPNNCTDDTQNVAQRHGAQLFIPTGKIGSKGDVMTQLVDHLAATHRYDALCVFDADNIAHPDFLQRMNDAAQSGVQAGQGFRDSKNPADSPVATCSSLWYWIMNRFYNGGRQAVGLSALIHGCGFMVSFGLLEKVGGWHTYTMTEDIEFSVQCNLAGYKVQYVPAAMFFDEQPLTFFESWKQRRRWSTGSLQGMERYLPALVRTAVRRRSWAYMDLVFTLVTPVTQVLGLCMSAFTFALAAYQVVELHVLPLSWVLGGFAVSALGGYLLCALFAAAVVKLNRPHSAKGTGRGVAYFAVYVFSWMPICLASLLKPQTTWDPIAHTRAIGFAEVAAGHR